MKFKSRGRAGYYRNVEEFRMCISQIQFYSFQDQPSLRLADVKLIMCKNLSSQIEFIGLLNIVYITAVLTNRCLGKYLGEKLNRKLNK